MLSKCPNCKSTFEIDEIQLTAADGLVRCGACLHVFNGRQHLAGTSADQKKIQEFSGIDEELEAIEAQIQAIAKQRSAPAKSKSLDADISDFSKLFDFQDDKTTPLQHMNDEINTFDITQGKPEQFESTEDFYNETWSSENEAQSEQLKNKHQSAQENINPPKSNQKKRSKLEEDIDNFFAFSDTIQHQGSGAQHYPQGSELKPKAKEIKKNLSHFEIRDEPLNLQIEEKQANKKWFLPAVMGAVVLICIGSVVFLMSQFQDLSQDPVWRPRLAKLCAVIQCALPPTHSTRFLKVTSLTTNAFEDKVEVNAVIYNTNPHFDMPFPHLKMKFTDINEKPVAEYEVHPDEYRQGELKKFDLFPSNTSAHITFILPTPGEAGVNYALSFSYPE